MISWPTINMDVTHLTFNNSGYCRIHNTLQTQFFFFPTIHWEWHKKYTGFAGAFIKLLCWLFIIALDTARVIMIPPLNVFAINVEISHLKY